MAVRMLRLCLWPLLLAALAAPVHAQEVQRITLDEALDIALERNIQLKQAANALDRERIQVTRERMDFFPDLRFSTNADQSYGRSFVQNEGRVVNETTESFSAGVGTSVNVFNGFSDQASLRQARLQEEAAQESFGHSRQATLFNVISTYLTVIENREQIRIAEENLEAQRQRLTQIEQFVEVGTRPVSDLYQQQAEVANAELLVLNAERSYRLSEANMVQILQLDPFGTYEFVVPDIEDRQLAGSDYDLEQLLRTAFSQRQDLQASRIRINAAEKGIDVAQAGYWPTVSLDARYGSGYSTANPLSFQDQFQDINRGGSVGFSFSIPIFDRMQTRTSTQLAQVQYDNAQLELEQLEQEIATEVRQAYLDYQTAQKRLDVTAARLRAAERALEAEQARYDAGSSTLVELSQARATYVEAASERVQARYDFLFQTKLLDYYQGRLDPDAPLFR